MTLIDTQTHNLTTHIKQEDDILNSLLPTFLKSLLSDIAQDSTLTHQELNLNLPLSLSDTLLEDTVISECMDLASHCYGQA